MERAQPFVRVVVRRRCVLVVPIDTALAAIEGKDVRVDRVEVRQRTYRGIAFARSCWPDRRCDGSDTSGPRY